MGILQARILEWVAMPVSWGSSAPRMELMSLTSTLAGQVLYHWLYLGSPGLPKRGRLLTEPKKKSRCWVIRWLSCLTDRATEMVNFR